MQEFEYFINGQKIVISNNLNAVPKDWSVEDVLKCKPIEGSLDLDIELNPLWKHQQETGKPKLVHISFLANFKE